MLKVEELRGLGVEELEEKANKLKRDLMNLRFQAKTGKLERKATLGETKKDIARILTIVSEKKNEAKS